MRITFSCVAGLSLLRENSPSCLGPYPCCHRGFAIRIRLMPESNRTHLLSRRPDDLFPLHCTVSVMIVFAVVDPDVPVTAMV
jgi:hypothetical protein